MSYVSYLQPMRLLLPDQVEQGVERRQGREGPDPGQVRLRRPGRGQEVPQAKPQEKCEYF